MAVFFAQPVGRIALFKSNQNQNLAIISQKIFFLGLNKNGLTYNSKITGRAKLKFGHNERSYESFMQTQFGGAGPVIK